jgi:hypothetical protein
MATPGGVHASPGSRDRDWPTESASLDLGPVVSFLTVVSILPVAGLLETTPRSPNSTDNLQSTTSFSICNGCIPKKIPHPHIAVWMGYRGHPSIVVCTDGSRCEVRPLRSLPTIAQPIGRNGEAGNPLIRRGTPDKGLAASPTHPLPRLDSSDRVETIDFATVRVSGIEPKATGVQLRKTPAATLPA